MTVARLRLGIIETATFAFLYVICTNTALADYFYGVTGAGGTASSLFTIDPTSGSVTSTNGIPLTGVPIVLSTNTSTNLVLSGVFYAGGTLYGVTNSTGAPVNTANSLVTISTSASTLGQATFVGGTNGLLTVTMQGVASSADGSSVYGYTKGSTADALYSISTSAGTATKIGNSPVPIPTSGDGLALNSSGALYFATGGVGGNLYTLTTSAPISATNQGTLAGTVPYNQIKGMVFDGPTLYGINFSTTTGPTQFDADLITITTGGQLTDIGPTQQGLIGLALVPTAAPEPSSVILVGLGTLGFVPYWAYRRRLRPVAAKAAHTA